MNSAANKAKGLSAVGLCRCRHFDQPRCRAMGRKSLSLCSNGRLSTAGKLTAPALFSESSADFLLPAHLTIRRRACSTVCFLVVPLAFEPPPLACHRYRYWCAFNFSSDVYGRTASYTLQDLQRSGVRGLGSINQMPTAFARRRRRTPPSARRRFGATP